MRMQVSLDRRRAGAASRFRDDPDDDLPCGVLR